MGNRLSKIYTRTGDGGETGLADGSRVKKSSLRIDVMGDVDELNSHLGVLAAGLKDETYLSQLHNIQHRLFDLGGEISIPGADLISQHNVEQIEAFIDGINAELSPLKEFILPGGSESASICFLARAICRRAERKIIALHEIEPTNQFSVQYLNRLSDLLFVMARAINKLTDEEEIYWQKD
jgi:cob(I)alamin adenosyltransferase